TGPRKALQQRQHPGVVVVGGVVRGLENPAESVRSEEVEPRAARDVDETKLRALDADESERAADDFEAGCRGGLAADWIGRLLPRLERGRRTAPRRAQIAQQHLGLEILAAREDGSERFAQPRKTEVRDALAAA